MPHPKKGTLSHFIGLKFTEEWRSFGIISFYIFLSLYRWRTLQASHSLINHIIWFWTLAIPSWFCATITHNSVHVPPFKSKLVNQYFFFPLLSLCYGFPVTILVPGHNISHHRFTQTAKDYMRTTKMRWKWNFMNLLFFVPTIVSQTTGHNAEYQKLQRKRNAPIIAQMDREKTFFFLMQFSFCCANWRKYVYVVLLPQLFAKWGIISINLFQHDGLPSHLEDEYNHSRNFVDPVLNFFTCNNGYHTAHHMRPGLHWSKLREYHEAKVKPFMNPCLDETSMFLFFLRSFVMPGGRTDLNGAPYVLPPSVPDEPWYMDTALLNQSYDG